MTYIENPKTKGSGIVCAIPQKGLCPVKCPDCFFQGGRSYLQKPNSNNPNDMSLPNMPKNVKPWQVVRVNDGNDSNNGRFYVMTDIKTAGYKQYFYNTSYPRLNFDAPVVLTVNPGKMRDHSFHKLEEIPKNLMMVRILVNTWNLDTIVYPAVDYYTSKKVPCILTFMAYNESIDLIPNDHREFYKISKRTLNSYAVIKKDFWRFIMMTFDNTPAEEYVYCCSKIEGHENASRKCERCGSCIREYHNTMERMNN